VPDKPSVEPTVTVQGAGTVPPGLVEAALSYERALMADDLTRMSAFFEHDGVRVDADGVLVGRATIDSYRGKRGGAGKRTVESLHVIPVTPEVAHVVSVNSPAKGGHGAVSQLWRKNHKGEWLIAAAHVSSPPPLVDGRVWRVVGAPLVRGADEGPLAGHTVAVKDLYAIAGQAIGVGVRAFLAEASSETVTAPAVTALLDAGADVLGIAQTDQFAYSIAGLNPDYGTPPNPAVPGGVPGGSSSGPASAVALGQVTIGLGTDTAGSIRVPASYQGLWGLRTTHGAVSLEGVAPLAPRYDTVGWMTRDGETLLAAASATLGDITARPEPSVLVSRDLIAVAPPALRDAFWSTLAAYDIEVTNVDTPSARDMFDAFRVTQQAEAWRANGEWVSAHPDALAPDVAERFRLAAAVSEELETEGLLDVARFGAELDDALGEAILVLPSAASAAPALDAKPKALNQIREATLSLTAVAGLTGRPALSVPWIRTPEGPVGLCLVGPRGSDLALIRVALAWETAAQPA
jgi:amidase